MYTMHSSYIELLKMQTNLQQQKTDDYRLGQERDWCEEQREHRL